MDSQSATPRDEKQQFDDALADFEAAWEAHLRGEKPSPGLRDFLDARGPFGIALALELAAIDLERRLKRGEEVRLERYLDQVPELRGNPDAIPALIRTEYEYRLGTERELPPDEYARRFPDCFDAALESSLRGVQAAYSTVGEKRGAERSARGRNTQPGRTLEASLKFTLLRLHARGGLGQVSLARDEVLGREVAVKEVRREMVDPEAHRRFLDEAEITARLDHPGVVPVHAVGRDPDGRPCYVMKFVNGPTLAQAIAAYHGQGQRPAGGAALAFRDLLQRFVSVCQAVAFAHSKGVLHRDLKPQNIVLGEFGETVVLDWGLACSASSVSTSEGPIGTPVCMPPEQARGMADARSDVFGLGAVLYTILTGRAPFEGAGKALDALSRAEKCEYLPPQRHNPRVPRALEAVCLKAMQREPADRYPNAAQVADDVQRWLADEPVSCYREPLPFRLARWSRRHPRTTGAMLVLLLVVAIGSIWGVRQVRQQALRQEAEALVQRGEALIEVGRWEAAKEPLLTAFARLEGESSIRDVRDRAERGLVRASGQTRWAEFRQTAAEAEHHLLGGYWTLLPHEETGRRQRVQASGRGGNLESGVARAEKALAIYGLPDDPEPQAALVRLGIPEEAADTARERVSELLFLLALGVERSRQGAADHPAARERASRLLEVAEAMGNHSRSLYEYRAKFGGAPSDSAPDPSTFLDRHLRAAELFHAGKFDESLAEFHQALALRPNEYWTMLRLSHTVERLKQLVQAESLVRSCITLRPSDPMLHNYRGTLLMQQGRWDESAGAFEQAVRHAPDLVMAHTNLILAHAERKDPPAAKVALDRFLTYKPTPRDAASGRTNLGLAFERIGTPNVALEHYTAALAIDPDCVDALRNRSLILGASNQRAEAGKDLERAIALDPENGDLHYLLGNWLAGGGRLEESVTAYTKALKLKPQRDTFYNCGVVRRRLRNYKDALDDQERALKLAPNFADAWHERALCYASQGELAAALDAMNTALALKPDDVSYLITRGQVRSDLRTPDTLKAAEVDLTRAIELDERSPGAHRGRAVARQRAENWTGAVDDFNRYLQLHPQAPDRASILNDLSVAFLELGRLDDAERTVNASVAIQPTPAVVTNRGNLFLRRGDTPRAVADFDMVLGAAPKFARAVALRAQARLLQGRHADALRDLERVQELAGEANLYETLVLRGLAYRGHGDEKAARADLERVAHDRPKHLRGRFAAGVLHLMAGRGPEAIIELSQATNDVTLRPFALGMRARAWVIVGGTAGEAAGTGDARVLATERPQDAGALLEAARVYALAGTGEGKDHAGYRERSLELLGKAVRLSADLRGKLASDEDLKALRDDPRFRELSVP